jgi:hypothetical protein
MDNKPRRQLTEEQLQKLAKAREKANETRRKNYEIKKFERENEKYEKEQQKLKKIEKQDEAYNAVIEIKKKREEEKQKKEQPKKPTKPKVKLEPEPEEEEEEEEEQEKPPLRKLISKAPPPPKPFERRARPQRTRQEPTDEELYENANIEILRQRLYQQTRARLANELFGY